MRYFETVKQDGFARLLKKSRDKTILSPGLINVTGEEFTQADKYTSFHPYPCDTSFFLSREQLMPLTFSNQLEIQYSTSSDTHDGILFIPFNPLVPVHSNYKVELKDAYIQYLNDIESLNEKRIGLSFPILLADDTALLHKVRDLNPSIIALNEVDRLILRSQRLLIGKLVTLIQELRAPDIAFYAPGNIRPEFFPVLVYLGIDFFDTSSAIIAAGKDIWFTNSGYSKQQVSCLCYACLNNRPLKEHNLLILHQKIVSIRDNLSNDSFRDFVEKEAYNSPSTMTLLKNIDQEESQIILQYIALSKSKRMDCIGQESLHRPEIKIFQEKVNKRYQPYPPTELVVILPCSSKKPYYLSKSHREFIRAIQAGARNYKSSVEELILTSPLGLVPRSLDMTFPAAHYDIPVTGKWSEEEVKLAEDQLYTAIIKYNPRIPIIVHVPHEYYEIIDRVEEKLISEYMLIRTSVKHPTAPESLKTLSGAIESYFGEMVSEPEPTPHRFFDWKRISAVADYQWGLGVGQKLLNEATFIKGKFPRVLNLFQNKKHLANFHPFEGKLTLSLDGAEIIKNEVKDYFVYFDGDKLKGSSLFCVGITKASDKIRPNDEIFVINENGELIATGEAILPGKEMVKAQNGAAVRLRNRAK